MNNETAIFFSHVFFAYDQLQLFENVSFSIPKGGITAFIGPNGSGKSTALQLIMGFLKPKNGEISVFGKTPKAIRHQIGYIPQNLQFDKQFPISTLEVVLTGVASKINFLGKYPIKEKARAKELLQQVGMEQHILQPFSSLSGGQMQKALLARALMNNPSLLLLDEPTANIDPYAEKTIYHLLDQLRKQATILIVTHDFESMIQKVDHVLVFQKEISLIEPKDVCKHYALGVYHEPDIQDRYE